MDNEITCLGIRVDGRSRLLKAQGRENPYCAARERALRKTRHVYRAEVCCLLYVFCFAEDIVLISRSINEAETMLKGLNEAGKRKGLWINRRDTQFMKNVYCEDGEVQLEGYQIVDTLSYVYFGRFMNMENSLKIRTE
ncbi:hypothetical protein RB195_010632 [Necator americanus]|uniref:Reverse transcriptase domain-containing protein n=1 Tax=Necator americanus TaxID=51031 RepID=A0ABR1D0L6_NECAM